MSKLSRLNLLLIYIATSVLIALFWAGAYPALLPVRAGDPGGGIGSSGDTNYAFLPHGIINVPCGI